MEKKELHNITVEENWKGDGLLSKLKVKMWKHYRQYTAYLYIVYSVDVFWIFTISQFVVGSRNHIYKL